MPGVQWTGSADSLGELARYGLSIQAAEGNRCGKSLEVYPWEYLGDADPWKSMESVRMAIGDWALANDDGTYSILTPEELCLDPADFDGRG